MSNQFSADKSLARPSAALKALRIKHGWTLAEVSQRTGLTASTLSKIENDKMSLTFDKLARLSSGLQIDISALFRGANGEDGQSAVSGRGIARETFPLSVLIDPRPALSRRTS